MCARRSSRWIPYRQVVLRHVLRNSLMAPVTVIMLHVNWLIGGLVVVESVFGYPGLGSFILNAALYKDVYAIEAGRDGPDRPGRGDAAHRRHPLLVPQPAHPLRIGGRWWTAQRSG
jgi:hypothetical protein